MIVLKELSELVQACKNIKKRMHPRGHSIHVDDIAETIQKIIDDEFARANRSYEERIIDDMKEEEGKQWEDWGNELAQLRTDHIENAKNDKGNA